MNTYTVWFFARCPVNGIPISYCLRIETTDVIRVEAITAAVHGIGESFHEAIADDLVRRFGGRQTLSAEHHGVHIETTRGLTHGRSHYIDQTVGGMAGTPGY